VSATLEELEGRVAELEATRPAIPTSVAQFLGVKIRADGSYDFDGHVHARGLDLDLPVGVAGSAGADKKVRWIRTSDGFAAADTYAYEDTETAYHVALVEAYGAPNSTRTAALRARSRDAGVGFQDSAVEAIADQASRMIYDSSGRSDFLQLADLANRKLGFGSSAVTFAAQTSSSVVVAHGLGVTPLYVLGLAKSGGVLQFNIVLAGTTARDAATFTMAAQTHVGQAAVTGDYDFDWIAIG
jgi:hypothetical protein